MDTGANQHSSAGLLTRPSRNVSSLREVDKEIIIMPSANLMFTRLCINLHQLPVGLDLSSNRWFGPGQGGQPPCQGHNPGLCLCAGSTGGRVCPHPPTVLDLGLKKTQL